MPSIAKEIAKINAKEAEEKDINLRELSTEMKTSSFKDIKALEMFFKLVGNLHDKLATYDTIISDDSSGRLVSLVLRKVIEEAKKRKRIEGGVHTYFVAAGRHGHRITNQMSDFLQSKKPEIQKALVVTEYIETGQSIGRIVDVLRSLDIKFDIATLSISNKLSRYSSKITRRLYYGEPNSSDGLKFYNRKNMTGITKSDTSPHPVKSREPDFEEINNARQDINRLAAELKKLI